MQAIAMSFTREGFKNRIEEYLIGALHEHLTARIGEAVGMTDYISHWDHEVERLLFAQLGPFLTLAKLKFNSSAASRRKAFDEVVKEIKEKNGPCLSFAAAHVKQILTKKKKPTRIPKENYHPDEWLNGFWGLVEEAIKETPVEIE